MLQLKNTDSRIRQGPETDTSRKSGIITGSGEGAGWLWLMAGISPADSGNQEVEEPLPKLVRHLRYREQPFAPEKSFYLCGTARETLWLSALTSALCADSTQPTTGCQS